MKDDQGTKQLQQIRDTVLQELTPILVNSDLSPEDKFSVQLSVARTTGVPERFEEALDTIRLFSEDRSKTNAYMDLLDAIDDQLRASESEEEKENTQEQ